MSMLDRNTVLAVSPKPFYNRGYGFLMNECRLNNKGGLQWYQKPANLYTKRKRIYESLTEAIEAATQENILLIRNLDELGLSDSELQSLTLKVEKRVKSLQRLVREEVKMRELAKLQHSSEIPPKLDDLVVPQDSNVIKTALLTQLKEYPYIRLARIPQQGISLVKTAENTWERIDHSQKTASYCYRETIARGFGFCGTDRWDVTKSKIRDLLLPRANKLLQDASIKRMLDEAYRRGQKVLVSGNYVFWYEETGELKGWQVKQASSSSSSGDSDTIWLEGKIVSRNHGRIVVLPHIKGDGTYVTGHTKNPAYDGEAKPRAPDEYLELPFEVITEDAMFNLLGQLKYE